MASPCPPPAMMTPSHPPSDPPPTIEVGTMFTPPPALFKVITNLSVAKMKNSFVKQFFLANLAGVFIALGGMSSIAFAKAIPSSDIGTQKFLFAAVFPIGLILVIFCGSELVTGNFAVLTVGILQRKLKIIDVIISWIVVWCGNFQGSIAVAYFWAYLPHMYSKDPWLTGVQGIAEAKVGVLAWGGIVLSAMGCNFLVCLAVFMATAARSLACKVLVIWWPIMTFVTIGFEHCVANMFLIPVGILYGANVTFGDFIGKNLIPVTLGNFLSASIFVACYYWYMYGNLPEIKPSKFQLRNPMAPIPLNIYVDGGSTPTSPAPNPSTSP